MGFLMCNQLIIHRLIEINNCSKNTEFSLTIISLLRIDFPSNDQFYKN